jgi:hypothetical protein
MGGMRATVGYVKELWEEIGRAHNTARQNLNTSLKRMKRSYDLRILARSYDKGDPVYVLDTATVKGKCKKLAPLWKEPGVISAFIYREKVKNTVFVTNHDRLKPCRDRKLPVWLQKWKDGSDEVMIQNSTVPVGSLGKGGS